MFVYFLLFRLPGDSCVMFNGFSYLSDLLNYVVFLLVSFRDFLALMFGLVIIAVLID